jgi:Brp/Blh family beta-carotene 15,15'-monooxygenase
VRNYLIPATFFCLWLTGFSSDRFEQVLALLFIFSFGILHGANDLFLLQKMVNNSVAVSLKNLLILYISFVFGTGIFFYLFPSFALWGFIIYSAYHFGEQHWELHLPQYLLGKKFFYFTYGLLILCLLFSFHGSKVVSVIGEIGSYTPDPSVFSYLTIILSIVVGAYMWFLFPKNMRLSSIPIEIVMLATLGIVFKTASLLWAFAIYFILWHALPSLKDQLHMLYGKANRENGIKYLGSATMYWVASLIGLTVMYLVFRNPKYGFLPIFFSFLAAITFPHVLVMSRFFKRLSGGDPS